MPEKKQDHYKQPRFERVKRQIEEHITSGIFNHGDMLPSESQLAELFQCSRNTIRRAVALLEEDDCLVKSKGKRSRINYPDVGRQIKPDRLAFFCDYQPTSLMHTNIIYTGIFETLIRSAACCGLAVDFFGIQSPDCWSRFQHNRSSYIGAFSVGLNDANVSRGAYERLLAIDNLIALDEVGNEPARHLISVDNYYGGMQAAHHLLQCSCRNIVMINLENGTRSFDLRKAGFTEALKKHPDVKYKTCSIGSFHSRDQMHNKFKNFLLKSVVEADGVFCYCDLTAMHVLSAVHFSNKKIPQNLSVIGFDGILIGQHTYPRLTSIGHPTDRIADEAVKLALELYENPDMDDRHIYIKGELLLGKTTKLSNSPKGLINNYE